MVRSQHIIVFFSVLNVFLVSGVSLRLLIVCSEGTNGGCEVMLMRHLTTQWLVRGENKLNLKLFRLPSLVISCEK